MDFKWEVERLYRTHWAVSASAGKMNEQSYKEAGVYTKLAAVGVSRSVTDLLPV